MTAPRALIAEDEPLLAQSLAAALGAAWPELAIVAVAPNGIEALRLIEVERPDIVFLDIRMPGLTGIEVAAHLADRASPEVPAPRIVFVTAYDEFALKAFELAAVDYLLKPVNPERLARTVTRARAQLAQPREDLDDLASKLRQLLAGESRPDGEPLKFIQAGSGNTVRMIAIDEVCYFQAADKYTSVVTADAEWLIRTSLRDLLSRLPPERFRQVHRATVVNMGAVSAAVRDDAGKLSLRLKQRKESLPVSRVFADLFRQM